jgi:uncharacterized protein
MQLNPEQKKLIQEIAIRYELLLIVLFGSRAKKLNHGESDTDIAVKSKKILNGEYILKLEDEFDSIFPRSEVVDIRTAPVLLLANIANDGICLFEKNDGLFVEFKISSINQYIEYKPVLNRQSALLKEITSNY